MTAKWAFGTLFKIGDGGGTEVFTTVAGVRSITPPQLSTDTEDGSDHQSPGGFEEVVPTMLRTGEVTAELNWNPAEATHNWTTGLLKDWRNKTRRNFQIVFNASMGGATWPFSGYVTGFSPGGLAFDGMASATVTIKCDGQITLT